jgi:hypothetical protein
MVKARTMHRSLVLLHVVLFAVSCGDGQSNLDLYPSPETVCETLGAQTCGQGEEGWVVLRCQLTPEDTLIWKVSKVCSHECADGLCVEPGKDAVSPDSVPDDVVSTDGPEPDDVVPPDERPEEGKPEDGPCVPDCAQKVCGDDGCGGSCGECPEAQVCVADGKGCCKPACAGKICGDDGCGGSCGDCPEGLVCNGYHQCAPPCEPKCAGKECGPDGCDGECGQCPPDKGCGPDFKCSVCLPQCQGKDCGDDGCGGKCGSCPYGYSCENFKCSEPCIPVCAGKDCGDDGCKGSCGECLPGEKCVGNLCIIPCEPDCAGKECGSDGCGGSCGKCASWATCSPQGVCVSDCVAPDCTGKECGDDGCGGSCGTCAAGKVCAQDGKCMSGGEGCGAVSEQGWCDGSVLLICVAGKLQVTDCKGEGKNVICEWMPALNGYACNQHEECVPDCAGKECGDDGCGGNCGSCLPGQFCEAGKCKGQGPCGDVLFQGCCSGDTVLWCDNGVLWFMDCSTQLDPAKKKCGWNDSLGGFYDCTDSAAKGPDQFPYYCEGPCVPSCAGKQCGDDGCGGSCGGCPAGTECKAFVCKGSQSECGGYSQKPACQGDTAVWCEKGQVFFQDCTQLGPFFKCGWVADLFVYGCYEEECTPDCEDKQCGDDGCGYVCGYCPATMFCNDKAQCVYGQGFCGDIDYTGKCDGNKVKWCQNGILQEFDCLKLGPTWQCGWYTDGGYYWCIQQ